MALRNPFSRLRRRFAADQQGAVTVEAVLWMPFFLILMFGIAEVAFVFYGQARALEIAQEASRSYSIGRLTSIDATETWVKNALSRFSDETEAFVTVNDMTVTTRITIPAKDLGGNLGIFTMFQDFRIQVSTEQVLEGRV